MASHKCDHELLRDWICFKLHGVTFTEYVTQCRREALGLPAATQTHERAS